MLQTTPAALALLVQTVQESSAAWLDRESYTRRIPPPQACFEGLRGAGPAFAREWATRLSGDGIEAAAAGRAVLIQAVLASLPRVGEQRVCDRVKRLLLEDFQRYSDSPERWKYMFAPDTVRFAEMVKLVTFQRFPAGQLQWEPIRFPRSFILSAGWRGGIRLTRCLLAMGSLGPLWEAHLNDRRPNSFLISEKASRKSYYRMALSMEMQPAVKGITVGSWLYSREVAQVSPHLAWLRQHFEENGGTVADLGPAPVDSGFLTGDPNRRALYESGAFRPRVTVAIWPRPAILDWAKRHPELED